MTEKQSPITHFGDKLKQWQPGESGNPGGRPKNESITAKLRKILDSKHKDGKTVAEHIADTIVNEILGPSGKYGFNTPLLKEILERVEGKVTEKHLIAGVITTPELLEQAQKRLSMSLNDTQELIEEHKGAI